ncbi:MAG TPA: peptidase MA family metallohydrolase [Anaerolineales bacterium]|nr:peptidase MA family metallohydrolase [Anaerolineales bacterium]
MHKKLILFLTLLTILLMPAKVQAALHADVQADTATLDFPNTATFSATLSASAEITSVTLEYGSEQLNCGEVIAKAFPDFSPSPSIDVSWTWDMRQSGSLPPGTTIWWRWRYVDSAGKEYLSDTNTVIWLDNDHDWQTATGTNIRIHYYGASQSFAQSMVDAGLEGLRRNKDQAGMTPDIPVDIYVYPSYDEMRDAILYEPQWTGGLAYSNFSIIIMGTSGDANFDKATVIHEVTHVLVGRNAFTCIGFIPTWLNEGLAVYNEGPLDESMKAQFDIALRDDTFFPVRSLSGNFSEIPEKALLSYAQSHSVVKFMLETYGQEKMSQLLQALSDAEPVDDALVQIYGVDTDGLDAAWRQSLGLQPLVVAQATSQPTPTYVPTYVPIAGIPQAITATPGAIPTSSSTNNSEPSFSGPPIVLTVVMLCICLVFLTIIGVVVLGIVLRNNKGNGGKKNG